MNNHTKFHQAAKRRQATIKAVHAATLVLEAAQREADTARKDLARVTHAVFGKRFAVFEGNQYHSPDGELLNITGFDGVIVPDAPAETPA
jgi:hypothetical protein